MPGGSLGPLPLKQGAGRGDLLALYARRGMKTLLTVKTINGSTVYRKMIAGSGVVTVGDFFQDRGWEVVVQNGTSFTFVNPNPNTKAEYVVNSGPFGKIASCIPNQTIY